uniref:Ig-like domain-containing protein n=1 Tax=Knipowitschia caucasica TaxID=637954 RepID=A0AAV2MD01_KNICA
MDYNKRSLKENHICLRHLKVQRLIHLGLQFAQPLETGIDMGDMKLYTFLLCFGFNYFNVFSQHSHLARYVVACSAHINSTRVLYDFDGDLILFVDFVNSDVIFTTPSFIHFDSSYFDNVFRNAWRARRTCLQTQLASILPGSKAPEVQDPPENILYPAEEVLLGIENRLVCFVNRFYPPVISVTWTKNNCPVSKGVTTSAYIPNKDTTFHCFSTLTFTPEQGDVYSCTVQHPALEEPTTRIWDVDVERHQDLAVDLYCGLGLTVAFVGVAIGTYLTIKKRYCH